MNLEALHDLPAAVQDCASRKLARAILFQAITDMQSTMQGRPPRGEKKLDAGLEAVFWMEDASWEWGGFSWACFWNGLDPEVYAAALRKWILRGCVTEEPPRRDEVGDHGGRANRPLSEQQKRTRPFAWEFADASDLIDGTRV